MLTVEQATIRVGEIKRRRCGNYFRIKIMSATAFLSPDHQSFRLSSVHSPSALHLDTHLALRLSVFVLLFNMFCSAFRTRIVGRNFPQLYQQHIGSISRRYITRTTQLRLPVQPPKPLPSGGYAAPKRPPTQQELAGLGRLAKIEVIEKLFHSGVKILYRAPARLAIFRFQNFILAAVLVGAVLTYQKFGLLDLEEFKRRGMPRIIYFLYMVIAAFMCGIAGILLYRTRNHVHAISLVERSNQIFLNITTRGLIPFAKSDVLALPENLVLRSKLVAPQSMPESGATGAPEQSSVTKAALNAPRRFLKDFTAASHCFFTNEGLIGLDILEPDAGKDAKNDDTGSAYKLDISGEWQVRKDGDLPVLFDIARVEHRPFSLGFFGLFFKR